MQSAKSGGAGSSAVGYILIKENGMEKIHAVFYCFDKPFVAEYTPMDLYYMSRDCKMRTENPDGILFGEGTG